ncbi:MAG: hypothetical protein L0Y44_09165 [Phycisphaerales bacterium]|nr:hypothetical protein [Phycisphaerales bacterium]MCI0675263.1 hypothetical protein [Phycisphaerales bacterium]
MSGRHAPSGTDRRRRAGVLFEVMLSVALFGGAAAFTLAAVRSVFANLDQLQRRQEAADLARSSLAELEAGLISLAELRDHSADGWTFDLKTSRSEFGDLVLVELTVKEAQQSENHDPDNAMSCTLRQLMSLREGREAKYEKDELVE